MSDQTPPSPDSAPPAEAAPPAAEIPAVDAPSADVADVSAGQAPAAPAQWPAEGYPPPPAYPAAPVASAPDAAAGYPAAYPPPAYPQPGYAAAPQTSSNAIVALVLAITSWVICPIVTAVVALVLASSAAKEIEASGGRVQGAGLVTAARIVSWVNIGLWAALLVVGAFFLVLAIVAGAVNETNF